MADLEVTGFQQLLDQLQKADLFDEDTQTALLDAGSDNLMETIHQEAARSGYNLTGIMSKLSKSRKVKKDKDGDPYKVVTITGKHHNGQRNATIAFVLNYGRSAQFGKIPGSYYWTRAVMRAEKTTQEKQEKIITDKLSEEGLI